MDVKEHKSFTTSSADIFDSAHDVRIDRAKFTNVAGNSTVNSFSNTFVLVKQESSGVGVRSFVLSFSVSVSAFPIINRRRMRFVFFLLDFVLGHSQHRPEGSV